MNTTVRRRFLFTIAAAVPLGRLPAPVLEARTDLDQRLKTPAGAVELLAEWELAANKFNWSARWHMMRYTGMIAWAPRVAIVYSHAAATIVGLYLRLCYLWIRAAAWGLFLPFH
jgi:hypothetical protein